jgi:hypothetical protein
VLIIIWRGQVTVEGLGLLIKLGAEFCEAREGPLACLTIVEARSPPPNDTVRRQYAAFHRALSVRVPLQIVVAEGSVFRAALVRSVGLALSTFSPKTLPFKFVTTLDEAAALIERQLPSSVGGPADLKHAVSSLRSKLPS